MERWFPQDHLVAVGDDRHFLSPALNVNNPVSSCGGLVHDGPPATTVTPVTDRAFGGCK
jgi:hypothetical protein